MQKQTKNSTLHTAKRTLCNHTPHCKAFTLQSHSTLQSERFASTLHTNKFFYCLKHFNKALVRFSANDGANANIKILWVNEEARQFLPLDLIDNLSDEKLWSWLKHRNIPRNRAYVDNLLSARGLSINRPMDVIKLSKGLSLNDCYWIVEENFSGTFEDFNLYDNRFSRILGEIAFTGYGSSAGSFLSSSPEFTTNGMLPKCWRRQKGEIMLFKGGTEGASNTGNEPYSEYYASQIADILGIDSVNYNLSKWKGKLCSTCKLFTSKELSYIPIGKIVTKGGITAVKEYYHTLGEVFENSLSDMFILDAVIFNSDRHLGNFGVLVDNKTNRIVAPAPLFDHGNSLFNLVGADVLKSEKAFEKYAKTVLPCLYDDFVDEARQALTHEKRNNLRKLLNFKLKKHTRYNLDSNRLKLIEKTVKKRVAKIISE